MFFYVVHEIINNIALTTQWSEGRKNTLTLMIGGYLHFFAFMCVQSLSKFSSNKIFELFSHFYWMFIFIDAFTMACLYKLYWGRSIVNELDESCDKNWNYDESNHKYVKKPTAEDNKKPNDLQFPPNIISSVTKAVIDDAEEREADYKEFGFNELDSKESKEHVSKESKEAESKEAESNK